MTTAILTRQWNRAFGVTIDRAMSTEANHQSLVHRVAADATPSMSVDQAYKDCLEELLAAFVAAARPDWDGYGARPVSEATVAQALAFLDLLPSTVHRPEISPHPDGELAFEWFVGPRRVLSVSVNESGRLSYAALLQHARQYGTEYLLDALPEAVTLALRRLHSPD